MSEIASQLRWACRRGMLELDILLGDFLNQAYVNLTPQEQTLFVKLLTYNDQELFEWLTEKSVPTEESIKLMVQKVRTHAKNKH